MFDRVSGKPNAHGNDRSGNYPCDRLYKPLRSLITGLAYLTGGVDNRRRQRLEEIAAEGTAEPGDDVTRSSETVLLRGRRDCQPGGWTLAISSGLSLSAFLALLILRTTPRRAETLRSTHI